MLKLMGMFFVMAACTLVGKNTARMYSLRPVQLRLLLQGLQYLETEIIFSCNSLPIAFSYVGEKLSGSVSKHFFAVAEILKENPFFTPKQAWDTAYKETKQGLYLRTQDESILNAFLTGLGQSHREEQLKQLQLVKELLRSELEKAQEESKKFVRMYNALGVSIGLTIVILLF